MVSNWAQIPFQELVDIATPEYHRVALSVRIGGIKDVSLANSPHSTTGRLGGPGFSAGRPRPSRHIRVGWEGLAFLLGDHVRLVTCGAAGRARLFSWVTTSVSAFGSAGLPLGVKPFGVKTFAHREPFGIKTLRAFGEAQPWWSRVLLEAQS